MKKQITRKLFYWLIAIFIMIMTVGCTVDEKTDASIESATESKVESANKAPTIEVQDKEVGYGTTLNYSDFATVTDEDSESVQLSVVTSELSGIIADNENQTLVLGTVGNFEIQVIATDEEGNTASEKVSVSVMDYEAPELILSASTFSLNAGDSAPNYKSIAKAIDNVDGDMTNAIKVDASAVNYDSAGTYEITYTVTDSSGNTAIQKATVTIVAKVTNSDTGSSTTYVLITRTGECYHTHKCGNGNFFEVTLEEALRRGLRKCKKCY